MDTNIKPSDNVVVTSSSGAKLVTMKKYHQTDNTYIFHPTESNKLNEVIVQEIDCNKNNFYAPEDAHYIIWGRVCEVSIDIQPKDSLTSYIELANLPKPMKEFYYEIPGCSNNSAPIIYLNKDGQLKITNATSGKIYFTHFTYITAE